MTGQIGLFDGEVLEVVRSPICAYQKHCGATATLGPPVDHGGCINRDVVCQRCGATGVESTNTETRK